MRILHTSDWHLGKRIYDTDTSELTQAFLDWLNDTINEQKIDCLIVAGDIFQTVTPTHIAQQQFYKFLANLKKNTSCQTVVAIAGNHDSPGLLTVSKDAYELLDVHIVGVADTDYENQVVEVLDSEGKPGAIIGIVPFPRERDIYQAEEGDEIEERKSLIEKAIRQHYQNIYDEANQLKGDRDLPIFLTGHLFATGTQLTDDEEKRAYFVGNLEQLPVDIFPKEAAYVALGHIHRPQVLGKDVTRNYSGSPYAMDFKEKNQKKYVRVVDCEGSQVTVTSLEVPKFVRFETIEGDIDFIDQRLEDLKAEDERIFCEITLENSLAEENAEKAVKVRNIRDYEKDSKLKIVRIWQGEGEHMYYAKPGNDEFVQEMTPESVFEERLKFSTYTEVEKNVLRRLYAKILESLKDEEEASQKKAEGRPQ